MEAKGQELWGQQVKGQPHFCQPEEFCRLILDNGQAFAVSQKLAPLSASKTLEMQAACTLSIISDDVSNFFASSSSCQRLDVCIWQQFQFFPVAQAAWTGRVSALLSSFRGEAEEKNSETKPTQFCPSTTTNVPQNLEIMPKNVLEYLFKPVLEHSL